VGAWTGRVGGGQEVAPTLVAEYRLAAETRLPASPDVEPGAIASVPVTAAALGQHAARGVVWFGLQTGLVKILNFAGQLVLAYLLAAEDFGNVGLTYTVGMLGSLVARAGVREVLISRAPEFTRWANSAFWMSLLFGCLGSGIMVAAAPVAGWFYQDHHLTGLVTVLSLQHVFTGLSAVPEAKLSVAMRFRFLAVLSLACSVGMTILTVLFAWVGLKAYSFMLPWTLVAAARMGIVWWAAPHPVRWQWNVSHWRSMARGNGLVFLSATFVAVTWHADYIVLGRLFSKETVGQYFWAFNLSTQSMQLLSVNVAGVLLAALARLNAEPVRQRDGFLRAAFLLNTVGAAACFLQAAAAGPFVRLLFEPEWHPAIPIVQVLSVGWATYTVFHTVISMLKAQGRFATLTWLTLACAVAFVVIVSAAAVMAGVIGTAVGVLIYSAAAGPLMVYVTVRPMGAGWPDVWRVFVPPILVAALPTALVAMAVAALPPTPLHDALALGLLLPAGTLLWVCAVRLFLPDAFAQLRSYLSRLRSGGKPGQSVSVNVTPAAP
jgi:O-antigen/teichoic acid export membrane protein